MFLRQSTASQEVLLGAFLDDTDGKTAETGLTIANTDIKIWKSGGTTEASKNSGGATHIAAGRYYAVLDATDTDTVGLLELNVHVSGALPVRRQFYVLEESVYDALFAASAAGYQVPIWASATSTVNLANTTIKTATDVETDTADIQTRLPAALTGAGNIKADALAISGDATAADNAELAFDGTGFGFTNCTMPTVATLTNLPAITTDWITAAGVSAAAVTKIQNGLSTLTQAHVTGGAYALNHASFAFNAALDFTTAQKAATLARVTLVDTTTTNTDMRGTDSAALAATALSTATWTNTRAGYLDNLSGGAVMLASSYSAPPSAATISTQVASDLATAHGSGSWATATGFSTLDAAGVRTAVGLAAANLDTQLADLPTVAEFEARTIVAANYGTSANQSAIVAYIDTEVAAILAAVDTEVGAIKSKTDQLVFTVANQVDSNALSGGGSGLDAAGVRAAVGLASANLDTQLADIPTVSEFNARTLVAAAYFDPGTDTVTTTDAASIAAILADTNELQSDWVNGGRLDLILDARASQSSVDDVPTNAELATALAGADDAVLAAVGALNNLSAAQVNAECDTALSDAGVTLARMGALTDWIDGGRLDTILDTIASNVAAILADTGTDGVALSAALCNKIADHVRRRTQANVEASSDGDTLSKSSQYGAIQQIQKSNTTDTAGLLTIKKTDGTTLGTLTLTSDSGADPATGIS